MRQSILILKNDFKMLFRDRLLRTLPLLPFLYLAIVFLIIPFANKHLPNIYAIHEIILMFCCLQTPSIGAFIIGNQYLEERDTGTISALQILPVNISILFFTRMMFWLILSLIVNFIMIRWGDLVIGVDNGRAIIGTLSFACYQILIMSFFIYFGKNKMQGFSLYKGISVVGYVPLVGYWLYGDYRWLFLIFPSSWPMYVVSPWVTLEVSSEVMFGLLILVFGGASYVFFSKLKVKFI